VILIIRDLTRRGCQRRDPLTWVQQGGPLQPRRVPPPFPFRASSFPAFWAPSQIRSSFAVSFLHPLARHHPCLLIRNEEKMNYLNVGLI
jgi:hypothetical protein